MSDKIGGDFVKDPSIERRIKRLRGLIAGTNQSIGCTNYCLEKVGLVPGLLAMKARAESDIAYYNGIHDLGLSDKNALQTQLGIKL